MILYFDHFLTRTVWFCPMWCYLPRWLTHTAGKLVLSWRCQPVAPHLPGFLASSPCGQSELLHSKVVQDCQVSCILTIFPQSTKADAAEASFFMFGPFFKSFLYLLQNCFCVMLWFFGHEACRILVPRPGINPAPSMQEGEFLTTGPPGKSPAFLS